MQYLNIIDNLMHRIFMIIKGFSQQQQQQKCIGNRKEKKLDEFFCVNYIHVPKQISLVCLILSKVVRYNTHEHSNGEQVAFLKDFM